MPKEPGSRMESSSQTPEEKKLDVADTLEMKALPSMMSGEVKMQRTAEEQKQRDKFGRMIALGAEIEGYEKKLEAIEREMQNNDQMQTERSEEKPKSFLERIGGMFRGSSRESEAKINKGKQEEEQARLKERHDEVSRMLSKAKEELDNIGK